MELTQAQLYSIAESCGLWLPNNSPQTIEEILDRAWDRRLVIEHKLNTAGKIYFYQRMLKLKKKTDCYGVLHDPLNELCKKCKIYERCFVVTNLPSLEELERDLYSEQFEAHPHQAQSLNYKMTHAKKLVEELKGELKDLSEGLADLEKTYEPKIRKRLKTKK